jgi:hypothetical protein
MACSQPPHRPEEVSPPSATHQSETFDWEPRSSWSPLIERRAPSVELSAWETSKPLAALSMLAIGVYFGLLIILLQIPALRRWYWRVTKAG